MQPTSSARAMVMPGLSASGRLNFRRRKMRWRGLAIILLLALVLSLASCATQTVPNVHRPPGFLMGLVHGFVSLFSLIGSLFFATRIYGFPTSGTRYALGCLL